MNTLNGRTPGYYWIKWSNFADPKLATRRPGPIVGEWDGKVWWFSRMNSYQFDCDVMVIGAFDGATAPLRLASAA
jgi:hypothetical protein